MDSYKNFFLIKGITIWNNISSFIKRITEASYSTYETILYIFNSEKDSWYLYGNSIYPLLCRYSYGLSTSEWKYNNNTCELIHLSGVNNESYRIGWLSARTVEGSKSKDMDGFLSDLRVKTNSKNSLSLMILLQAWSIYDKKWWSGIDSVCLEWIDDMAEEYSATRNESPCIPLVLLDSHLLKRKN